MQAIFEAAGGSQKEHLRPDVIMVELGLTVDELADACRYLQGEGLLGVFWGNDVPVSVWLEHAGIVETERAQKSPEVATEHFPPFVHVNQTFHGNVVGSAIQAGSPGASQAATISTGNVDLSTVHRLLDVWDTSEDVKALPADIAEEANGEVEILRALVKANKPYELLAQTLRSLRAVLEGGAGLLAGTEVMHLLHMVT
jgi:hypothetical protein